MQSLENQAQSILNFLLSGIGLGMVMVRFSTFNYMDPQLQYFRKAGTGMTELSYLVKLRDVRYSLLC